MEVQQTKLKIRSYPIALLITAIFFSLTVYFTKDFNGRMAVDGLFFPLCRLLIMVAAGLAIGQIIESLGWTNFLSLLTRPLFR